MPDENFSLSTERSYESSRVTDLLRDAWIQHVQGTNEETEKLFREAMEVDPHSSEAAYGLGLSLKIQKRNDESIEAFQHALSLLDQYGIPESPVRAAMLRHLSKAHISMINRGRNIEESP